MFSPLLFRGVLSLVEGFCFCVGFWLLALRLVDGFWLLLASGFWSMASGCFWLLFLEYCLWSVEELRLLAMALHRCLLRRRNMPKMEMKLCAKLA
jgi:hypothetical protein